MFSLAPRLVAQRAVVRGFRAAARRNGKVLFVGLSPEHVDYEKWAKLRPEMELTAEKLRTSLELSLKQIADTGHEGVGCWIDLGETAEAVVRAELEKTAYDCVLVGAGVRMDPDNFLLFEKLMNVVHEAAPNAKIAFNTSPESSAEAVTRCLG